MVDGRVIAVSSDKDTTTTTTSPPVTMTTPTSVVTTNDVISGSQVGLFTTPILDQLTNAGSRKSLDRNNSNNNCTMTSQQTNNERDVIAVLARCVRSLHERLEASERRNQALTSQVDDLNSKLRGQLIPVVRAMIEIRDEFRSVSSSCDLPSSPAPSDTSSFTTDLIRPLYASVNKAKRPLPSLPPVNNTEVTPPPPPPPAKSVYESIEVSDSNSGEKTLLGRIRRKISSTSSNKLSTASTGHLPRSSGVLTSRSTALDDDVFENEPIKEHLPFEWHSVPLHPSDDDVIQRRRCMTSSANSHVSFDELDEILEATRKLADCCDISDDSRISPPSGVILNEAQDHQEELRRLESGGVAAQWSQPPPQPDEAPPKPRRPRAGAGLVPGAGATPTHRPAGAYPPNMYPPTSQTGGHGGIYPPSIPPGRMPLVPPKTHPKIMSPEDVIKHEAQEKLRQRQLEEQKIQETLEKQKQQLAADDDWLRQSEQQMNPDVLAAGVANLKVDSTTGSSSGDPAHIYSSADEVRPNSVASSSSSAPPPPPPSVAPAKPPRNPPPRGHSSALPKVEFEEVKPTPTMQIDRRDDKIYHDTMMVVKAVLQANQAILKASSNEILEHVKTIGGALKTLVTSVSLELPKIEESHHRDIDMAQKTTNKDLSQIIAQMRLVNRFISTSQVADYKKCLMAATQVLAMDVKNLLDVVDTARIHSARSTSSAATSPHPPPPNLSSSSSSQDLISSADDDELPLPPPPSQFLDG